jgi:phosphatidylserine decarboxylase
MDVHVNRVPVSGRVTKVSFKPGKFLPAYRHDAGSANERSEIWIDHRGQQIVARQIVGILARRVVCRVTVDATVGAGDRYGIMKFGSRMDVFLPESAKLQVAVGETVRGGETVIAVLDSGQAGDQNAHAT